VEQPPKYLEPITPDPNAPKAPRAERIEYPVSRRLERMRAFSKLLDSQFPLFGNFRIGIDPIIGLIPGIGDFIASSLSVWLIYEAARLGLQKRILAFMTCNVMMEAIFGTVPLLGTAVDAVWKANVRNMRLVEKYYRPTMKERSRTRLVFFLLIVLFFIYGTIALAFYTLVAWLAALFGPIFSFTL
jgi:hypothetical protein